MNNLCKRKMIVLIDFDGTIVDNCFPLLGDLKENVVDAIKFIHDDLNCETILWTCRSGKYLDEAINVCVQNNIPIDYVNENSPTMIKLFPENDCRKVYGDIVIDDHNIDAKIDWFSFVLKIIDYKNEHSDEFI